MPSPKSSELLSKPTNKTIHSFKSLPCKRTESLDYSSSQAAHIIDLPPDSYWVPKEDEKDWFDQNAIISRSSSRKLSFTGCPTHHVHQENLTPHRSSLSYNYTSSKAPFIGLPVGHQKPYLPSGHHRHHKAVERRTNNPYFLRSRSEPGSKLVLQVTEPASPQVNCLGKVGTKKEKVEKKTGLWQNITTVFKTGFNKSHLISSTTPVSHCDLVINKERTGPVEEQPQQQSLAGLMRLRSGRRSSGIIEPKGE
ncbi:hypothetical protein LIER_41958 [Lithospermum erythrorhizon]|uniref:Uncharacterized protein n=1 Tax=Lithospermum erythrorhizon TaxID=34254 RepID=A0AAV3RLG0_LITER